MKCAFHPDVETNLSCGKCGQPICPKCLVETPVGARCPDCAKVTKLPTYRLGTKHYLVAAGTALGMALATGLVWGILRALLPYIFVNVILGGGVGFAIGEVVSRTVNRKRGIGIAVMGGIAVVISYIIGIIVPWGTYFSFYDILAVAAGVFMAVIRIR